ncbi:MAG TPA: glycosyltransferase family 4 protein [Chthoniobacterales bacterium]|nr:glycosyltransferase family 4 protein [Chthoniobacterales bacterium]
MRIAILTTDNREHHRRYELPTPVFGPAIEALLQGLATISELEIHVVSCTQRPMEAPEKLARNIWFHLVDVPKIGWLRTGYQGCIRAIRKRLQLIQPNIVHGQGTERECALSAVFSGFPNVVTIHGNMVPIVRATRAPIGTYWWWAAILERFTLPRTDGVFCNSRYTESVVRPRACRTWLVPNAVRREFFEIPLPVRSTSSPPILLNVGAIVPHKRQLELLPVLEKLHDQGHTFQANFIGKADPRSKYAGEFLHRINAPELKTFIKHTDSQRLHELIMAYDTASALIHVPTEEAFGLVAAEALSRNLKFFGTQTGGLRDIAHEVATAELLDAKEPEQLYRAITRWLQQDCLRPTTAAATMRMRYHPDVIAQGHERVYRELLSFRK